MDIPILGSILTFYEAIWIEQAARFADLGLLYGWVALASLVVVAVGAIFATFRRADGVQVAVMVGQHVLLFALPYILGTFWPAA